MLKKAGAVVAATAGLLMLGAPAFAAVHPMHSKDTGQIGLVNVNDIDVLHNVSAAVGVCGNNVAVLGAIVPIASPPITHNCASSEIESADN